MTTILNYKGHELRVQHVSDCVQLLIDNTLVDEQVITGKHQWDDFELIFSTDIDEFRYGVHMSIFYDTITIRTQDVILRQFKMSLSDFVTLRTKTT